MVSFQCEACGDVFTKKKLDPHRNSCHGASFSCLDCMVHFRGTEYRAHTSCITEAQKYQGNLYKEKPEKPKNQKRKSVTIAPEPITLNPRAPYVEDAPDADDRNGASPPPPAPSPPPPGPPRTPTITSGKEQPNVFDFLDESGTPTTATHPSSAAAAADDKPMKMVTHAPSIFDPPKHLVRIEDARDEETTDYDFAYEENGFSYGSGPIPPATIYAEPANMSMEFMTPAPKLSKKDRRRQEAQQPPSLEHSRTNSLTGTSDKKRKRGQPEKLSLSRYEEDVAMTDVSSGVPHNQMSMTPTLNHSGLTGGLSQMMRTYSPSPEYRSDGETYTHHHPVSPIKRTRRGNNANSNNKETNGHNENGLGISIKGGAGRLISLLGSATGVTSMNGSSNDPSSKALIRTRRHSSSDGENDKARKAARKQKHRDETKRKRRTSTALVPVNGHGSDSDDSDRPRTMKAIEYRRRTDSDDRSRSPQGTKSHHKGKRDKDRSKNNTNGNNQLVLYKQSDSDDPTAAEELRRERAAQFLAMVNKGPESERGCSLHKTLKRFRRECSSSMGSEDRDQNQKGGERGRERGRGRRDRKEDDEQDLWRLLRLKRNDRGEIVLFI